MKSLTEDEIERINEVLQADEPLMKDPNQTDEQEDYKDGEAPLETQLESIYATKDPTTKSETAEVLSKASKFTKQSQQSLLSSLQSQLEEEKQARLKLEAELLSLRKFTMEIQD